MIEADLTDEMVQLRADVDSIDAVMVRLLAKRLNSTDRIGQIKALLGEPALNAERQAKRGDWLRHLAQVHQVDESLVLDLFASIRVHTVARHELAARRHDAEATSLPKRRAAAP